MRLVPLVRLAWIHPFLDFFREAGAPVDRYLTEARVPAEVDQNLELAFPMVPLYDVIDRLVHESGREDVGLAVGGGTRIRGLGSFGRHVLSQATLGDAIATAQALISSVHAARQLHLSTAGGFACLAATLNPGQLAPTPWDDQFTLSVLIDLVRMVAGSNWFPQQAATQSRQPRERSSLPGLDGVVLLDGTDATAIKFPCSLLGRRLAQERGRVPERAAERCADADLNPLPTDLVDYLQMTLDALVTAGRTDRRSLARAVGTSTRTLARRLSDQGRSFRELLGHSRLALARQQLLVTSYPVMHIASNAGYSHPAHFTRAFRRWTGQTPAEYRSGHSAEAA